MRKFLQLLPLILFPYMYMIVFAVVMMLGNYTDVINEGVSKFLDQYGLLLILATIVVSNTWSFVIAIVNSLSASKGKIDVRKACYWNMLIKLIQIPAYIINFIIGLFSFALSVWGVGFLIWVVIVDLLTIFYTGINAIGACVASSKQKVWPKWVTVLFGFLNFIYCVDVCVAIVMYVKTRYTKQISD